MRSAAETGKRRVLILGAGPVRLGWGARLRLAGHLAGLVKRASEWRHPQEARGPERARRTPAPARQAKTP